MGVKGAVGGLQMCTKWATKWMKALNVQALDVQRLDQPHDCDILYEFLVTAEFLCECILIRTYQIWGFQVSIVIIF